MHIYSLRLWLVMIAVFTGVSVAQAEDKCWILHEWTVTKGQPAGKPKQMSECLEGKIVKEGDVSVCEKWNRGSTQREMAYFTDKDCKNGNLATGANTSKIPDGQNAKIHTGKGAKPSKKIETREQFEAEKARTMREGGMMEPSRFGGFGAAPPEKRKPSGGFGSAVTEPAQ